MWEWIKKLIIEIKKWFRIRRAEKVFKKVPPKYKPVLLAYALNESHLSKKEIKKKMNADENLSKRTIRRIVSLGSKKVAYFLRFGEIN